MFFFWGPFFFIFPALAIYFLIRHFFGPNRDRRDSRWIDDFNSFQNPLQFGEEQSLKSARVQIYKVAYKLKGRLTVSDIVMETGIDADEAEELIQSMVDDQRIRMEVREVCVRHTL